MQPAERADFGDAPKQCARHRMLPRLLIAGGFALAGSVLLGVGTASADESDSSSGLLSALTDSATESLATVTDLPDAVSDAVELVDLESVSPDDSDVDTADDAADADADVSDRARESDDVALAADTDEPESDRILDAAPRRLPVAERSDTLRSTIEPVTQVAEPVVTVAEPVVQVVGPVVQVVEPVVAVVEPVLDLVDPALVIIEPVIRPVVGLTDPVVREVTDLLAPATTIVAPVADTVVSTITPAIEPIAPVVNPVLEPLGHVGRGSTSVISQPVPAHTGVEADVLSAGHVERDSIVPTAQHAEAASLDDSASTVFHYSLDASPDDQPSPSDSREGHWPSQLPTPLAGLVGLQAGAPGAVTSVDQTGSMSHSLLPEEAVQRARFISAAAYARSVEGLSQREATNPPVSPD
jgi:hypothetical protein